MKTLVKRLTISLEDGDKERIEQRLKRDYPKIKTVSGLVRAALDEFLGEKKQNSAGM